MIDAIVIPLAQVGYGLRDFLSGLTTETKAGRAEWFLTRRALGWEAAHNILEGCYEAEYIAFPVPNQLTCKIVGRPATIDGDFYRAELTVELRHTEIRLSDGMERELSELFSAIVHRPRPQPAAPDNGPTERTDAP